MVQNNDFILKMYMDNRAELMAQVHKIEQLIAERKAELMSSTQVDTDKKVRPGQYVGLKIADALENYLSERGGGPIKIDKIAADLAVAGVKLGQLERHQRNIKIMIASAAGIGRFELDDATDAVTLVRGPAPPQLVKQRRRA